MARPTTIDRLIETLREAGTSTDVETGSSSFARITVDGEAEPFTLSAEECELIFDDADNVDRLHEAIGYRHADIELRHVNMDEDVLSALETTFSVEEI